MLGIGCPREPYFITNLILTLYNVDVHPWEVNVTSISSHNHMLPTIRITLLKFHSSNYHIPTINQAPPNSYTLHKMTMLEILSIETMFCFLTREISLIEALFFFLKVVNILRFPISLLVVECIFLQNP